VTLSSTGAKQEPALDETSFQQLLSAAYVVQQHNEEQRGKDPDSGTSQALSVIAEIQSLIRTGNLNIAAAAALIANRLLAMSHASGVSISLITDGYLDCVAEMGMPAKVPGSCVSTHSLVATERLKAGSVFESDNSQTDMRLDIQLCRSVGVGSLVAVPVHRFGEIAGLVEVRWSRPIAFGESELRTCRLMAGLVSGTLERSVRIGNARIKHVVENPPEISPAPPKISNESPVDAIATGTDAPVAGSEAHSAWPELVADAELELDAATSEQPASCRVCGRPFGIDETFCGFCSMPRASVSPSEDLQSKWASLWFMQRAKGALQEVQTDVVRAPTTASPRDVAPASTRASEVAIVPAEPTPLTRVLRARTEAGDSHADIRSVPKVEVPTHEGSFPFSERPPFWERTAHFAKRHWRDGVLASVAIALAYGLISAWPKGASQPTWFQSLMVRFGAMQVRSQAPVFAGNPDVRVWLDVHTQLYYCEGSDLYGKTPDGEFTTQHNAQSDGYQSASNATCP
jgi:hypothetical protein